MPLTRPTVASAPLTSGALEAVTPPAPTSEAVASGGSVTGWTFGAFTDPDGRIASYSATLTAVVGSGSLSGSGLGPYSISGTANGDSYTVELDALDGDGAVLATATHSIAIASGSTQYELNFDGVDAYTIGYTTGNVPASMQIDFASESVTLAMLVRADLWATNYRQGAFGVSATGGTAEYFIQTDSYHRYSMSIRWSGTGFAGSGSETVWAQVFTGLAYVLIVGQWDHTTGQCTIATPNTTRSGSVVTAATPTDWSGSAYGFGSRYAWFPTTNTFSGGMQQAAIWRSAQVANIADLWNDGVWIDWSTLANPPDIAHYLIGADDDDSAADGIQDRTGNGHDLTMINATPDGLAAIARPKW